MLNAGIIYQITEKLKKAHPDKIILFGSYAYGTPNENSDIDLLIVTSDNYIPKSYAEKSKLILKINALIAEEKSEMPIDLIIHTLPMHEKFIRLNSMFSREILQKGEILYERNNTTLA
jgi:predicted nucleotidyltransferase